METCKETISPEAYAAFEELFHDWLTENRDQIEAGGSGDLYAFGRRFKPASMNCRIRPDRPPSVFAARLSKASIISGGNRTGMTGSRPVGRRPGFRLSSGLFGLVTAVIPFSRLTP
jgi:hypothetical protein